jgi:hypothetical protein
MDRWKATKTYRPEFQTAECGPQRSLEVSDTFLLFHGGLELSRHVSCMWAIYLVPVLSRILGDLVLSGCYDNTVNIFGIQGDKKLVIPGHSGPVKVREYQCWGSASFWASRIRIH